MRTSIHENSEARFPGGEKRALLITFKDSARAPITGSMETEELARDMFDTLITFSTVGCGRQTFEFYGGAANFLAQDIAYILLIEVEGYQAPLPGEVIEGSPARLN